MIEGGLRPSWEEEGRPRTQGGRQAGGTFGRPRVQSSPERRKPRPQWRCPDLHQQFLLFSKFGETGSDGSQITLTQSDKWMRQAKVIEGWNVTTTDTAIAFRKISRGSIWLEYNPWREFLEELTSRKNIDMQEVSMSSGPLYIIQTNKNSIFHLKL